MQVMLATLLLVLVGTGLVAATIAGAPVGYALYRVFEKRSSIS